MLWKTAYCQQRSKVRGKEDYAELGIIIKGRTKGRSDKKASLIICLLIWRAFGFAELNKVPSAYGNSIFALSACEFIAGCDISQNWDRGNYRFL